MPLDLESLSTQIEQMTQNLSLDASSDRLAAAREQFLTQDAAYLRGRLDDPQAHPAWLVGYPLEPLTNRYPLPPHSDNFCVVASDGSAIYPDRHSPVRYYVINSGYAILTYGSRPDAELGSRCKLFYEDEDVFISPKYQTLPIDGALVAVKMAVSELETLVQVAEAISEPEALALRDGTLIIWGLDSPGLSEEVRTRFLGPYLDALETLRQRRVPVASYISFPGSDEVINALRVGLCPDEHVVCTRCATLRDHGLNACAGIVPLEDRRLLSAMLEDGQRTGLWLSRQPVVRKFYPHPAQQILFFYVNVGGEIGRIEVPQWVADDAGLLDRAHALVVDQCRRGRGFPPALVEAHEQAVIAMGDRQLVEQLLEAALVQLQIYVARSLKDRSKRERSI